MSGERVAEIPLRTHTRQDDPATLVQTQRLDDITDPQTRGVQPVHCTTHPVAGLIARPRLAVMQRQVPPRDPHRCQGPKVGVPHAHQRLQQPPQNRIVVDRGPHDDTVPQEPAPARRSSTTMATRLIPTTLVPVDLQVRRLGVVPFKEAWELQREIHDAVVAGDMADTLLLLEHPSVYTAGRRTQPEDRPLDGTPVIDVDRGGRITWHGPGQLVGYPIIHLTQPLDVVGYVRRLEELLIITCERFGVAGERVDGRSGVWVAGTPERKIAAIGVRVARGVTMHGFALNVNSDLHAYDRIVPCGITDATVTSLRSELGGPVPMQDVADTVAGLARILQSREAPA